jgi:hypothetical protein
MRKPSAAARAPVEAGAPSIDPYVAEDDPFDEIEREREADCHEKQATYDQHRERRHQETGERGHDRQVSGGGAQLG